MHTLPGSRGARILRFSGTLQINHEIQTVGCTVLNDVTTNFVDVPVYIVK